MYKGVGGLIVSRAILEIIGPLRAAGINAVIAGGFMRDNALGRPWRDIDLYIGQWDWVEACDILFGEHIESADFQEGDGEYDHQSIGKQVEHTSTLMDSALINLVGLGNDTPTNFSPEFVTSKFNLGICMVATDGFTLHVDQRFLLDMADAKITLYRSDWGLEASMKQWIKLQAKYPWPLRLSV